MKLKNKVAVITGAGSGIGREIAIGLAKEGATIIVVSRNLAKLKQVADGIVYNIKGKAIPIATDLTKEHEVDELVDQVINMYGKIDILINNAGGYPSEIYDLKSKQPLKIWDWNVKQWDIIIESNLKTTFLCCKKIIPIMIKQNNGHIINMSSRMGRIASQMGAYAAAKSAIIALTKTIAIQTAKYGIVCNAISPGMIDTAAQRNYNETVNNDNPIMGNTDGIVKSTLYLLCDAPIQMNGQSLDLFKTI